MSAVVFTKPSEIRMVRLLSLRGRMKLNLGGIRFRGPSVFVLVKREFGFKGSREQVYTQFCEYIEKQKELL